MQYRKYKKFEVHSFLQDFEQPPEKISYTEWEKGFVKTTNKHAPLKTKEISRNHKSFITKNLRKAIMKISALKKRVNMSNNSEIIKLYKKHENYVLISVEKLRQNIFKSICHTVNLLKILGNFTNHSFQIEQQNYTGRKRRSSL